MSATFPDLASAASGLVPSKTSGDELIISLDQGACAERRVKRLKRSVWGSGHLHGIAEKGHRPAVAWFVTLTYAKADAWAPSHISEGIRAWRYWCKRRGVKCRYTWVAEIQPQRAARTGAEVVHYHLMAWLPVGVSMPKWDLPQSGRVPFWMHGMTNTEPARAGIGYLMKYLSKLGEFTHFPKGLRLYGIGGLDEQARNVRTWLNLPQWAKCASGVGDLKRFSGGFVVRATGEILKSPYRVSIVPGAIIVRLIGTISPRFHDGVYSTFPRPV